MPFTVTGAMAVASIADPTRRWAPSPTTTPPGGATDCRREAVFTTSPTTFSPICGPVASVTTASPVSTATRTWNARSGFARPSSPTRRWIASAARTARRGSSSCTAGTPNTPIAASPMNLSSVPPWRSISSTAIRWNGTRVPRTSSGSAWSERAVNPTRSANSTETTRRSSRRRRLRGERRRADHAEPRPVGVLLATGGADRHRAKCRAAAGGGSTCTERPRGPHCSFHDGSRRREHPRGGRVPRRERRAPERRRGGRRQRVRRPVRRGRPAPGRAGLRGPRARRRRRRDLARQLVPGLRVRRPQPSVLVLLRPQPELEPFVLAAAGDPGVPAGRRAVVRRAAARTVRDGGARRAMGSRGAPVADRDDPGRPGGPGAGRRDRPAVRTGDPESPRPGAVRGDGVPLRAVAARPRPGRRAGRGRRDRRVRDPVRPAPSAFGVAPDAVPADGAVGAPPPGPRPLAARAVGVPAGPGRPAARPVGDLLVAGELDPRVRAVGLAHGRRRGLRAVGAPAAGAGPGPPRQAHARLPAGVQAGAPGERLLPARSSGRTSRW